MARIFNVGSFFEKKKLIAVRKTKKTFNVEVFGPIPISTWELRPAIAVAHFDMEKMLKRGRKKGNEKKERERRVWLKDLD